MTFKLRLSNWGLGPAAQCAWLCLFGCLLSGTMAEAQIVLDGTMGPAGVVAGDHVTIPDTDGTLVGDNLFHSFSQFNIQAQQSATFTGPANIANLLSRVTGGSPSTIDGLLQTSGMPDASFFLINPAGVLFGPDAQIDVPAAFVVTTADVIKLADGGLFAAAIDPDDSVLTSAPPSAFGFLGDSPGPIKIDGSTLKVGQGQAISLVGGEMRIQGGIEAPSGRVSLMSVASPGWVSHNPSDQTADLDVDAFAELGEIHMDRGSGESGLSVAGDPGGSVSIRGGRLVIEDYYMNARTEGQTDHPGTGFDIELTGDMILKGTPEGAAEIACSSASNATGDAGDIRIAAKRLEITGDATSGSDTNIGSRAFGAGDAGDIDITTEELVLNEYCFLSAPALGAGNGGNITIDAGSVELSGENGWTYISTLSQGGGAAGTVEITADRFVARGGAGGYVGVTTQTNQLGTGSAGDLRITARTVELLNGAQLNASLFNAEGIGGDIEVTADSVLVSGYNPYWYPAGIFSNAGDTGVGETVTGKGGSVRVKAGTLELTQGGQLGAWTSGRGQAGSIEVDADAVEISGWSGIYAGSSGSGCGGDVSITAETLNVENRSWVSSRATSADPSADGGSLEVNAHSIRIAGPESAADPFGNDFTGFFAGAFGGRAGNVKITADSLELSSRAQIGAYVWGSEPAGDVLLDVGTLQVLSGSNILSSTFGSGAGGNVTVTADDVVLSGVHPDPYSFMGLTQLSPSGIAAQTGTGSGNAGKIVITAQRLEVLDGAFLTATTAGPGNAGTIDMTADEVVVSGTNSVHEQFLREQGLDPNLASSGIYSASAGVEGSPDPVTGDAGTIRVQARELRVTDGGRISSETETSGDGGSIACQVGDLWVADGGEIASSSMGAGDAGTVGVDALRNIEMHAGASISTRADEANAGNFVLKAGESINLTESQITARAAEDGGDIKLTAGDRVDLLNSVITTEAGGSGGNITIDPVFTILDHSRLVADAILGRGGNILIVTDVFLPSHSTISASSEYGVAGTIEITAPYADLAGTLSTLPESLLSAELQLSDPCVTRFLRGASSFVVIGAEGLPIEPGGWLPSFEIQLPETADEEVKP